LFARFLKAMEYYLKILHVRVLEEVGELQGQGLRVVAATEGEEASAEPRSTSEEDMRAGIRASKGQCRGPARRPSAAATASCLPRSPLDF
jgi:hypothetical protein